MDIKLFLETMPLMAEGMFGIFLITLLLMGMISLLNKIDFDSKQKNRRKEK